MSLGQADVIQRHSQQRGGDIAMHFEGEHLSYGQLWRCIESATQTLKQAGVQPGDRVACLSLNHPRVIALPSATFPCAKSMAQQKRARCRSALHARVPSRTRAARAAQHRVCRCGWWMNRATRFNRLVLAKFAFAPPT